MELEPNETTECRNTAKGREIKTGTIIYVSSKCNERMSTKESQIRLLKSHHESNAIFQNKISLLTFRTADLDNLNFHQQSPSK